MATRGGVRKGAGAKKGSGQFKEQTIVKRIPESLVATVDEWLNDYKFNLALPKNTLRPLADAPTMSIPVSADSVRAGFPSPAGPYIAEYLDFNTYLVSNPAATIAVTVKGDSMVDAGMSEGDLLVVNRALTAQHRDVVLVELDNEFTVKRLIYTTSGIELHPENAHAQYPIIKPKAESVMNLVGIVTHIIKKMR